jgi:hypothetical protein
MPVVELISCHDDEPNGTRSTAFEGRADRSVAVRGHVVGADTRSTAGGLRTGSEVVGAAVLWAHDRVVVGESVGQWSAPESAPRAGSEPSRIRYTAICSPSTAKVRPWPRGSPRPVREQIFDELRQFSNLRTGYDLRGATYDRLRETPLQGPVPPVDLPGGDDDRHPIRYLQ